MPKTIAAPFPHAQAHAEPRAREHTRTAKPFERTERIDARVSALEARWEATVPTLATIADLRGVENRLIRWVLGAAAGLLLALLGIVSSTNARFDSVNARIDSVAAELRAEIRETNARMEARFERMDAKFERMDAKFDALMAELRSQRSDSR